jgi:RimJ/RimL family protein N-acetyltransferase
MQVFLETERLVLRRFTMADAGSLAGLDADPDVMRFITGGVPTPRAEIEDEVLPAFLRYYERFVGYGFWRPSRSPAGRSWGGSISGRRKVAPLGRPSSAAGCVSRPGAAVTPRKGHSR